MLVAPFNNVDVTARRIREHCHDLAAVIVEPVLGAGGMLPPEPGFLPFLQDITRQHDIPLIADEVVSFRLAHGGAQQRYGLEPDLTMLGKTIGGGLPVAAIGGRADIMALTSFDLPAAGGRADTTGPSSYGLPAVGRGADAPAPPSLGLSATGAPRLSLSGTFSGAALGMAAGRASLEALDPAAIQHINRLGDLLTTAPPPPPIAPSWPPCTCGCSRAASPPTPAAPGTPPPP
jgi:glutamate-1-semialdehyde aminotransferase